MFSFQEKGLHTSLLWHCVFIALVCTVNEWITPQNTVQRHLVSVLSSMWGHWVGRQRCKEPAWFSILAQGKEWKGLSEFGNDWACHCRAGFLWTAEEPKLCPPPLSLAQLSTEKWGTMVEQKLSHGCGSWSVKAFQKVVGPVICWYFEAQHAQASLVLHQPESSLSAIPTSVGNSLHPEWFGCQCIYPVSVIQWYDNIFCTFECLSCTPLTTVSLEALAKLVWPQLAAIFFWTHLLYWIPVPGGTPEPVVEIRLLSYKSEGLGKIAYFTSEKGD